MRRFIATGLVGFVAITTAELDRVGLAGKADKQNDRMARVISVLGRASTNGELV
jgi:hypothetical protein